MDEVGPFEKQIKSYQLICRPAEHSLVFILTDIPQDQLYYHIYQEHTLPPEISKYVNSLQALHHFVKNKTKVFKVMEKGVVMCAQYLGKVEKYILLKMMEYKSPNPFL